MLKQFSCWDIEKNDLNKYKHDILAKSSVS